MDTLRRFFDEDPASRMMIHPDAEDSESGEGSGDAFPWGAGHRTLRWTHASEQAGKALRSQGHQCVVM